MKFDLVSPCRHCPFRTDIEPFLRPERARQIAAFLEAGEHFICHKTLAQDEDGEDDPHETAESQHCAGALIVLERIEQPNQLMRIAERLRCYDPSKLSMDAPVFATLDDWIAAQR